ncbi:hypothetical protein JAAARDRAFT_59872 [Jaapia argillacea MUCL 33604]|uniref:Uncharacterized protein n=1 Tax=Jaapia argillacea MUCL 33604 TaxID=933084 RepID=A0A067PYC1_9AGAM|nr:hypothetical protein JAAARDRAFT_59872 [Jaapia argillacea MUCL 33604]
MNKQGGKKVSTGHASLTCLNLPPSIHYKLENIYLTGVIPGPREPSLKQINHYLKPLVNDFLMARNDGLYLSRTCGYPLGRRVRCAILILVCDLPASRKVGGSASYAMKKFSSLCKLEKKDIDNTDPSTWPRWTHEDYLTCTQKWLDAPSAKAREAIFTQFGICWSELLRLPYWDPMKMVVVDAMQNLLLGILKHHFCVVLGIDLNDDHEQDEKPMPALVSESVMEKA